MPQTEWALKIFYGYTYYANTVGAKYSNYVASPHHWPGLLHNLFTIACIKAIASTAVPSAASNKLTLSIS